MRTFTFAFVVAIAACGTSTGPDNSDQLDAPIGKADEASRPNGAYQNATPHYGELSTLTLNDDMTFYRSAIGACAGGGTCTPILQTGTYIFTHGTGSHSSSHYVRFYDDNGTELDRYEWKLASGGTLQLELSGDDHWFSMDHGGSCEAAGGTCVPLVPDSCANGTVGDATQYSCGGGVGVECCLPAQPSNQCNADSDCSGILPDFCRVCSDGSESCAHWSCAQNMCQIVTCQ